MFFYFCHILAIMIIATLPIYYAELARSTFPVVLKIWIYAHTINNCWSTIPFVTLTKEIKFLSSENRSWHHHALFTKVTKAFSLHCPRPRPVIYLSSAAQIFTSATLHKVKCCILSPQTLKHLKYHSEVIKCFVVDGVFCFSFLLFLSLVPFLPPSLPSFFSSFLLLSLHKMCSIVIKHQTLYQQS